MKLYIHVYTSMCVLLWRAAAAFFLGCLRQGQSDSAEFTEETAFSRVQRPFYRRKPVVAKNACEGFAPPTIAPTDTFTNFSHLLNLALLCSSHCSTTICYTYMLLLPYPFFVLSTNLYSMWVCAYIVPYFPQISLGPKG